MLRKPLTAIWLGLVAASVVFTEAEARRLCERHPGFHRTNEWCWEDDDGARIEFLPPPLTLPPPPAPPPNVTLLDGQYWANDGYDFNSSDGHDLSVHWSPGKRSGQWPHVHAAEREHFWAPDDGYDFNSRGSDIDFRVSWTPGARHSRFEHIHASNVTGWWTADEGFRFYNPNDLSVEPIPNYWEAANLRSEIKNLDYDLDRQAKAMQSTLDQVRARSHGIWDAERALNQWARSGRLYADQAKEIALDAWWDVTKSSWEFLAPLWAHRIGDKQLQRITKTIDQYARKRGIKVRKIEPQNTKFLKDMYGAFKDEYHVAKNARDASKYWNEGEYHLAVGSLFEAANTMFPSSESELIGISIKDGEIWISDIEAYLTASQARKHVYQLSKLQGSDLEALKSLSKTWEHQVEENRELIEERNGLVKRLNAL